MRAQRPASKGWLEERRQEHEGGGLLLTEKGYLKGTPRMT